MVALHCTYLWIIALLAIWARADSQETTCAEGGGTCVSEDDNSCAHEANYPGCDEDEICCTSAAAVFVKRDADACKIINPIPEKCKKHAGICRTECPEDRIHTGDCSPECKCCGCKIKSICKKYNGHCIRRGDECDGDTYNDFCHGKNCTCCIPTTPTVESLIRSMNTTLDKKLTEIYEEVQQDCVDEHKQCREWALRGECRINPAYMHFRCRKSCLLCDTCVMLMNDRLSDPLNYYIFAIPRLLSVGVNLCPPGSVSVSYEIPSFQSYDSSVEGITCTDNSWVLEQHRQGKTNCHMGLEYNTDFWYSDAPDWSEVHQPYYEAMRNCYANSCNGLVCTDDFDTCWLKINTPGDGHGEPVTRENRNFWTTVCQ